jgi:hypothetical protein
LLLDDLGSGLPGYGLVLNDDLTVRAARSRPPFLAPSVLDDFAGGYGAEPATLWAEVLHQLRLRLRSIGFSDAGCDSPGRRVIHS